MRVPEGFVAVVERWLIVDAGSGRRLPMIRCTCFHSHSRDLQPRVGPLYSLDTLSGFALAEYRRATDDELQQLVAWESEIAVCGSDMVGLFRRCRERKLGHDVLALVWLSMGRPWPFVIKSPPSQRCLLQHFPGRTRTMESGVVRFMFTDSRYTELFGLKAIECINSGGKLTFSIRGSVWQVNIRTWYVW